MAEVSIVLIAD